MASGKQNLKKFNCANIPDTLEDEIFYGLVLDEEQKIFRDAIWNPEKIAVLCNAKAGSGKTLISIGVANLLVQYGLYDGIVYIVSPVMEQRQGYLPGGEDDKNAPYMQPLVDALLTLNLDPSKVIISENNMTALKNGTAFIEFKADTFLRGTNLENKVVIVDEAQNFYFDLLKKTLTRIHDNCCTIIIGQAEQIDLVHKAERSGFTTYIEAFKKAIENGETRAQVCELHTNHRGWLSNFCDKVEPNYKK